MGQNINESVSKTKISFGKIKILSKGYFCDVGEMSYYFVQSREMKCHKDEIGFRVIENILLAIKKAKFAIGMEETLSRFVQIGIM